MIDHRGHILAQPIQILTDGNIAQNPLDGIHFLKCHTAGMHLDRNAAAVLAMERGLITAVSIAEDIKVQTNLAPVHIMQLIYGQRTQLISIIAAQLNGLPVGFKNLASPVSDQNGVNAVFKKLMIATMSLLQPFVEHGVLNGSACQAAKTRHYQE